MRIFHLALFFGVPLLANAAEKQQSTAQHYFFDYSAMQRNFNLLQNGIHRYLSSESEQLCMLAPSLIVFLRLCEWLE
ncbi:RAQPRD family integrative conjugative element protein [Klebsiella sp. K-Nf6]|uniref:RAQPRD family integrative conjugative element protein n=1 Tax=Klebsiella sp. K-Nf6 TaxID=2054595 RepID=UPI000C28330D|nr:RAQPRD family integrative conjugative element protein [Klebsiella sp. K-Nf6]PJR61339.1 hypothetical protein CWM61_20115 [Klebsiella sp. K-Nf6]